MIRGLRRRARDTFFHTLRRALESDDGRDIVVRALNGLLAPSPRLPCLEMTSPYPDVGRAAEAAPDYRDVIFISARFRTGSTLLWNIFRHTRNCVAYYEPFNERRWFDPGTRGTRVDPTHRAVDDYWREYDGLADLGQIYRESWVDRQLVMDESTWAPGMRRYIERLIEHARPRRPVLQFNRVDFRLPWLRRQFPGAAIVHLYRHPRDQWCSSLVRPEEVPRDVTLASFEPFDHYYLARWARDLGRHFPFLTDLGETSAYRTFYVIWKLSYLYGSTSANYALSFEALTASPCEQVEALLRRLALGGDAGTLAALVGKPPGTDWRRFADDDWFRQHESSCEALLSEFVRGQATAVHHVRPPRVSARGARRRGLTIAERDDGIDAAGPSRWNEARKQRHSDERA
jgi:hypothetical protein